MDFIPRIGLASTLLLAACTTDPGDVGSGSDDAAETHGTSGSTTDGGGSQSSATASDDDGESAGSTTPTEGSDGHGETVDPSATDDAPGTEDTGATDDAASSTDDGIGETGTMVASCADCGPDEGCVAEVAFATEYFCVPWPDTCAGHEFNCACASQFCVDPFTVCQDLPDPPQRAIACECPTC